MKINVFQVFTTFLNHNYTSETSTFHQQVISFIFYLIDEASFHKKHKSIDVHFFNFTILYFMFKL